MAEVVQVLPQAVGIAVSPIPLLATTLLLLSSRARMASLGLALGWVAGVSGVVAGFGLAAAVLPTGSQTVVHTVLELLNVLLGVVVAAMGWVQWRRRPPPGQPGALPRWIAAMGTLNGGQAAGLGVLLTVANPKNLLLAATAGMTLGRGAHPVAASGVFVLIAVSSVVGLVVAHLLAGNPMAACLNRLQGWLEANGATFTPVVLMVLGVAIIGNTLASW